MSDTTNYRPVAVATVVSKLLAHFILSSISPFLGTTDNQFGFKAGHSTDQCTFLLKQTASYFVTHGSSVHAVFLDASKAFDRLHMKLFEKLIQRKAHRKRVDMQCENENVCNTKLRNTKTILAFPTMLDILNNYNSTSLSFFQANSCTSLQQFCFRNNSLSILISDK